MQIFVISAFVGILNSLIRDPVVMLNISEITAKHFCIHPDIIRSIEKIILRHSIRGMDTLHTFMTPGYTFRAAKLLLESLEASGNILIATGFPILESYETDGPIGAIALYNVMKQLGGFPVFVCAYPLAAVFEKEYTFCKVPFVHPARYKKKDRVQLLMVTIIP